MVISEEIISKNVIKPSSPTPNRFKNHKLSYLDQIAPSIYIPLILFYQNDESKPKQQVEISQLLKQSLSQILTIFYPLAGTLVQENSYVDCNDAGVEFIEARVHAGLAQIIEDPKMEELKKLVPVDSSSHSDNAILLVKINIFDCGGIAVGVCLSHKVADFASLVLFIDAWAAACRGEAQVVQPSFDMAIHFPPRDLTPSCFTPDEEKMATKRLVFNREKLERLRQQAASTSEVKNPTTVEALSSFIWQSFIEATKAKPDAKKTSFAAAHAVNLRPRTVPPIPDQAFGNCSIGALAFISNSSDDLVSKSSAAMRAVDDSYIKKVVLSNAEYSRTLNKTTDLFKSNIDLCMFSSWWRFPVNDIDFGWGKPAWACTTTMPYKNLVTLMSTPSGDGIEAWVNTSEDFLPMLETNYNKLLS